MNIIEGGISLDERGQIRYVNQFDLKDVRRFYLIKNLNTDIIRGWRGHKIEKRWFYVISGEFIIDYLQIDDWDKPSKDCEINRIILSDQQSNTLMLTPGYCTLIQSTKPNSELLVFSDFRVEHAEFDDYTWPNDYFLNRQLI